MYCNQIFSLISSKSGIGTVENIIVADNYEVANQLARNLYGASAYAVDTTLCPVGIGDKHIDGVFYRYDKSTGADVEIPYNPTEAQEIAMLKDYAETQAGMIEQITTDNADLLYEISLLELGLV